MNQPKQSMDFFVNESKRREFSGYVGMYWGSLMNAFTSGKTTPQIYLELMDLANYINESTKPDSSVIIALEAIGKHLRENRLIDAMMRTYDMQEELMRVQLK